MDEQPSCWHPIFYPFPFTVKRVSLYFVFIQKPLELSPFHQINQSLIFVDFFLFLEFSQIGSGLAFGHFTFHLIQFFDQVLCQLIVLLIIFPAHLKSSKSDFVCENYELKISSRFFWIFGHFRIFWIWLLISKWTPWCILTRYYFLWIP